MGFPKQEYWRGLPFPSPGDTVREIQAVALNVLSQTSRISITWELVRDSVLNQDVWRPDTAICAFNKFSR